MQRIGEYAIVRRIAGGGMATVFLASHPTFGDRVALKVLSPRATEDEEYTVRFRREGQVIASLDHPHIVKVHEVGCVSGYPFIAMEYLPYGTLKERLARIQAGGELMPIAEAAEVARQMASALDYAHQRGLIHRDVKPSNILLGTGGRYVLSDFGVALVPSATRLTRDRSQAPGTVEYLSPEQADRRPYDHRVDVYALGVVLYEMLAGRTPFAGDTDMAVLLGHAHRQPAPISAFRTDVPREVVQMVEIALAKDPDQRYQTAGQVMLVLSQEPPPRRERRRGVPSKGITAGAAALAIASLAALLAPRTTAAPAAPGPAAAPSVSATASEEWAPCARLVILRAGVARAGPGDTHPAVAQVMPGDRLDVLAKDGASAWWQAAWPDGRIAWVAAGDGVLIGDPAAVRLAPSGTRPLR